MIKLFLVALLCVAVFADSPVADGMNQMRRSMETMVDMAQHAMDKYTNSLVRRAAQMGGQRQGPPQGPPQGPSQRGSQGSEMN